MDTDPGASYAIGRQIGKGSFGEVFLVTHKESGASFVLKRIRLAKQSDWQRSSSMQERDLMCTLEHPFIVPHIESWVHQGHTVNIICGYCEKGDLGSLLQKEKSKHLSEEQLQLWLCELLLALDYLQARKVLHRDVKTSNVMLTAAGDVQLGDFGLATFRDTEDDCRHEDSNLVGTPHFMSPELLGHKGYSFKSDVWSLGCVMYEMTAQRPAFNAFDLQGLVTKIQRHKVPPLPSCYSAEWKEVLELMLKKDQNKRPSVQELMALPAIRPAMLRARARAREVCPHMVLPPLLDPVVPCAVGCTVASPAGGSDEDASSSGQGDTSKAASRTSPSKAPAAQQPGKGPAAPAGPSYSTPVPVRRSNLVGRLAAAAAAAVGAAPRSDIKTPATGASSAAASRSASAMRRAAAGETPSSSSRPSRIPKLDIGAAAAAAVKHPAPFKSARALATRTSTTPSARGAMTARRAVTPAPQRSNPVTSRSRTTPRARPEASAAAGAGAATPASARNTPSTVPTLDSLKARVLNLTSGSKATSSVRAAASPLASGRSSLQPLALEADIARAGTPEEEGSGLAAAAQAGQTQAQQRQQRASSLEAKYESLEALVQQSLHIRERGASATPQREAPLAAAAETALRPAAELPACLRAKAKPQQPVPRNMTPQRVPTWQQPALQRTKTPSPRTAEQQPQRGASRPRSATRQQPLLQQLEPAAAGGLDFSAAGLPKAAAGPDGTPELWWGARPKVEQSAERMPTRAAGAGRAEAGGLAVPALVLPPSVRSRPALEAGAALDGAATVVRGERPAPLLALSPPGSAGSPAAGVAAGLAPALGRQQQERLQLLERVVGLCAQLYEHRRWSELGAVLQGIAPPATVAGVAATRAAPPPDGEYRSPALVGDVVRVGSRGVVGVIRYYGPVHWDPSGETYVGIALEQAVGTSAGLVDGVHYFEAAPGHARFLRAQLLVADAATSAAPKGGGAQVAVAAGAQAAVGARSWR